MEITTRHTPAYGVARLTLGGGESVMVEAGAMMSMSAGVSIDSKAQGGMLKSIKRAALGGESFFVSTYTAPAQGGFVDVAARLPGDLSSFELGDTALFIAKGSWLANETTVAVETQWGGFKNLFGSEGGFILRTSGSGYVAFSCYGALEVWTLNEGEHFTLDTGHMVAYEETVTMQIRQAAGGLVQTFKSGEGLVFDFTGPGRVWTQTRNPHELLGWVRAAIGGGATGGGGGALGGLLGRN
jgi:uncharacterized protein (TIGR00266 family)